MNNKEEINFYIQDRQYILSWVDWDGYIINEVITFILNDIRQKLKTDLLTVYDLNNQVIEDVLMSQQLHFFIRTQNQNLETNQIKQRELKSLFIVSICNLRVEKYKGQKKLESVSYQMQTIRNLNAKYLETLTLLKGKVDLDSQQKIIERSANAYPVTRQQNLIGIKQANYAINQKEYTIVEIGMHNKEQDAWIALEDKVYDVTLYINQHPGGRELLMQAIGKDATSLFMQNHPWVSASYILQNFQVGYYKR